MLWHAHMLTMRATLFYSTTLYAEVLYNILKIIKSLHHCEGGGRADPSVNGKCPRETLFNVSRQESVRAGIVKAGRRHFISCFHLPVVFREMEDCPFTQ